MIRSNLLAITTVFVTFIELEHLQIIKTRSRKVLKSVTTGMLKPPRRAKIQRASSSAISALSSVSKPNMSRRLPYNNVIVAFPSFDKCDSLVYFPTTFTKHLNNGDMSALGKLFVSHLDKNCDIAMANCYRFKNHTLGPQLFLKSYEATQRAAA